MGWDNSGCCCKVPDAMECARRRHRISCELRGENIPFDEHEPDNTCDCWCHSGDGEDEDY